MSDGNHIVESYMFEVGCAIDKHLPHLSAESIEIYNKCYEAIDKAITGLESQLADTQARLVVSEKRLKLIQQISDGRRALMVCYRLGTHKSADAALTRIEKAEVALAMLGGEA